MGHKFLLSHYQKAEIEKLYFEEKLSAREIAIKMHVGITTVYRFMRTHKIKRRNPRELSKIAFEKKPGSYTLPNKQNSLKCKQLKTAGTIMYWCEGATSLKAKGIDFANSKPAMIKLFVEFLNKTCGVNKNRLRALIYYHDNQDIAKITDFWSNLTGIPATQFTKPYIRTNTDSSKSNKMPYGLVHIRYYDKKLLNQVKAWIVEEIVHLTNL